MLALENDTVSQAKGNSSSSQLNDSGESVEPEAYRPSTEPYVTHLADDCSYSLAQWVQKASIWSVLSLPSRTSVVAVVYLGQ